MIIRFKVWRVRRQARYLSKLNSQTVVGWYGEPFTGVKVGTFRRGKEVR